MQAKVDRHGPGLTYLPVRFLKVVLELSQAALAMLHLMSIYRRPQACTVHAGNARYNHMHAVDLTPLKSGHL